MSYSFSAADKGIGGDVDFDFFDDPPVESPTALGNSGGKWSSESKGQDSKKSDSPIQNGRRKNSHRSPSVSESDNYSSDYTDDSGDESHRSHENSKSTNANSKNVRKIEAKIPSANDDKPKQRRRHSRSPSPDERKYISSKGRAPRPKTGHEKDRGQRRSRSYSSNSDDYTASSDSDSYTGSDSDVTDVSPLHSPHNSSRVNRRPHQETMSQRAKSGKPPKSPGHKEVTFQRPFSASSSEQRSNREPLTRGDCDSIDLKLLMQAVTEMERTRTRGTMMSEQPLFPVPKQRAAPVNRKNQSFSNEHVRDIDRENQRLMNQIMRMTQKPKKPKKAPKSKAQSTGITGSRNMMSSAAINRHRQQMRIENENLSFLKRLQKTKPTKQIARDELLVDYQNQVLFGCSVAAAHPEQPNKPPSPYAVTFNPGFHPLKSHSTSNLRDNARYDYAAHEEQVEASPKRTRPISAITRGSRPMSATDTAKRRPQSAKVHGTMPSGGDEVTPATRYQRGRPAWEERW